MGCDILEKKKTKTKKAGLELDPDHDHDLGPDTNPDTDPDLGLDIDLDIDPDIDPDIEIDLRSVYKCVRCGTCRSVCPVFDQLGWESYNTRGRILVIKSFLDGCKPDSGVIDSLSTCTTCGICTENCPAGVRPPEIVQDARRHLVSKGITTPAQADFRRKVASSGNVFGAGQDRLAWLSDRSSLKKKRSDYVYFVGCLDSYRYPEVAARTFEVLERFDVALLPDERCCGSPLLRTGSDATESIDRNLEQIEKIGAHTVITGCAGCYTTLKKDYPGKFRVLSVPEFLAEHISELDLRPLEITVTYHDPCHLGRHNQIYEEPRRVIRAICNLVEMKASREKARCCGGGGGVRAGYGDLSLKIAKRRLEDVPEGVDLIVTSCPLCVRNLRDAGGDVKVVDLVELVAEAMK